MDLLELLLELRAQGDDFGEIDFVERRQDRGRLLCADERLRDLVGLQSASALVEAGHEDLRVVARDDDVRLECAEAGLDDFAAKRRDRVVRVELRCPRHLVRPRPRRPAV